MVVLDMPSIEELKSRFPHASDDFIRANADVLPSIPDEAAIRSGALEAARVSRLTTDEELLNKTERRWLDVLRGRNYSHVMVKPITLKLGHDCRYTPDLVTADTAGLVTIWEVKGAYVYEKAMYKPRMAARMFPFFRFVLAQWKDGQWTESLIKP